MAFVKSLLWLGGCSGFAYLLLQTITPNDTELKKVLPEGQVHHRPDPKQRAAFIAVLERAANIQKPKSEEKLNSRTPTEAGK